MTFMLLRDRAPRTVDAIAGLTTSGFYNSNTIFHRVEPGFVIQGGDPNTNGSGGAAFYYDDEYHPRSLYTGNGQLGCAKGQDDANGSQFFITLGPQRALDLRYTIFGQLVRGSNVMSAIFSTPTSGSRPLADVIITRASLVPDTTDTVITLSGTNLVTGTIKVVADDGVGGKATNSFSATTVSDAANNDRPILWPAGVTNRVAPLNTKLTNTVTALDLEGNAFFWDIQFTDQNSYMNASNSTFNNGLLIIVPHTNFSGPIHFYTAVSPDNFFSTYDYQDQTVVFGDTLIKGVGTNFTVLPMVEFSSHVLATFTNGVPNSAASNFTASINWGDNSVSAGTVQTNAAGRKEVRGTHTYTNSGNYPIYIWLTSYLGANTTVISTSTVLPSVTLSRTGTNNTLRWPAWAFDYTAQTHTNLTTANWVSLTNLSVLSGYENVVTNGSSGSNVYFRLKK
jgi:peptidyl-prolyl cis-trans isomerase A (cyclophilin A)